MTYVIGDQNDNYPYSSVVLVQTTWSDGSGSNGTGVMVGPNDVLTAAHCFGTLILGMLPPLPSLRDTMMGVRRSAQSPPPGGIVINGTHSVPTSSRAQMVYSMSSSRNGT